MLSLISSADTAALILELILVQTVIKLYSMFQDCPSV